MSKTGPERLRAEAESLARYGKIEQWHHAAFNDLADEWERERAVDTVLIERGQLVPAEVREAVRVIYANHYLQSGTAMILARFIQQLDGKGGDDGE